MCGANVENLEPQNKSEGQQERLQGERTPLQQIQNDDRQSPRIRVDRSMERGGSQTVEAIVHQSGVPMTPAGTKTSSTPQVNGFVAPLTTKANVRTDLNASCMERGTPQDANSRERGRLGAPFFSPQPGSTTPRTCIGEYRLFSCPAPRAMPCQHHIELCQLFRRPRSLRKRSRSLSRVGIPPLRTRKRYVTCQTRMSTAILMTQAAVTCCSRE